MTQSLGSSAVSDESVSRPFYPPTLSREWPGEEANLEAGPSWGYHISEIISHFKRNDTCLCWPLSLIYSLPTCLVIRMRTLSPESLWPKVLQKSDVLSPDLPASGALHRIAGAGGAELLAACKEGGHLHRAFFKAFFKALQGSAGGGGLEPRRGLLCWKEMQDRRREP